MTLDLHLPALNRYARSLMWSREDADDLVQSTCLNAWRRRHLFEVGTNLEAWLFTIMRNLYADHVRREVRKPTMRVLSELDLKHRPSYGSAPDAGLVVRDLTRALERLTPGQRALVLARGIDGASYEAMAREFDIPMGTVRSRLNRGRVRLAEMMA
jgi:RNA polymerase sigma-70 factor, ECF subfamily